MLSVSQEIESMLFVGNFAHMIISAPRIPTIFCPTAFRGPPIDRMGIPALSTDTPRRLRSAVVYPNAVNTHFPAYQFVCRYDWDAVVQVARFTGAAGEIVFDK